jgi:hypothetical protein
MKQVLLFFYLLFASTLFAQQFDNSWIIGYCGCNNNPPIPNDEFGVYIGGFNNSKLELTDLGNKAVNMNESNTSISDSSGNLLFYCNGERVYNKNHQTMSNGDGLVTNGNGYGYVQAQSSIIIAKPGESKLYYLLHWEKGYLSNGDVVAKKLFLNIVDMNENNGLGKVTLKRDLILEDTLVPGKLNAVKHANGRDWWVIMPERNTNKYYRLLISDADSILVDKIAFDHPIENGLGQSVFSPDGEIFVIASGINAMLPSYINIFNFDRCSGLLSNQRSSTYDSIGFGAFVAISPNSRYLYLSHLQFLVQYDLTASDIFATEQLIARHNEKLSGIFPSYWSRAQLAPDGRIYLSTTAATFNMHTINYPDRGGDSCRFVQDAVPLQFYNLTIPTFPHYRLGPIDGSPCDTLGFDNHPLCHWRWEQERLNLPLEVTFTDLTTYEPTYWLWDFGDGSTSTERHPFHTYDSAGVYTVCLVVGNANSSDTLCRVLPLGEVSSSEEVEAQQRRVSVTPNPFTDHLTVFTPDTERDLRFQLFTVLGSVVIDQAISGGVVRIETGELAAGVYFWRVLKGGRVVQSDLIVR